MSNAEREQLLRQVSIARKTETLKNLEISQSPLKEIEAIFKTQEELWMREYLSNNSAVTISLSSAAIRGVFRPTYYYTPQKETGRRKSMSNGGLQAPVKPGRSIKNAKKDRRLSIPMLEIDGLMGTQTKLMPYLTTSQGESSQLLTCSSCSIGTPCECLLREDSCSGSPKESI